MANGSNKKVGHGLIALSSAAVVAVYGAGYTQTRAAADRFTAHAAERRPRRPAVQRDGGAPAALRVQDAPVAAAPTTAAAIAAGTAVVAAPGRSLQAEPRTTADSSSPAVTSRIAAAPAADRAQTRATSSASAAADLTSPAAPRVAEPSSAAGAAVAADAATVPAAPSPVAPAPVAPPVAAATQESPALRDGTYLGWGSCRHGDIQASVVIENGRIASATVAQCLTRYSCSWINPLPPQIVKQQGTTFDYVSGATESSDAFQEAVADALSHAQ